MEGISGDGETQQIVPPDAARSTMGDASIAHQSESAALAIVEKVRALIPSWRRSVAGAIAEANAPTPDWAGLRLLLDEDGRPSAAATEIPDDAGAVLGTHADFLIQALKTADKWWTSAEQSADASNRTRVVSDMQRAASALDAAMLHVLFLTFLNDVRRSRVGEAHGIVEYCQDWGLTSAQVSMLWRWLTTDPRRFSGKDLPIVLDTVNRRAYRQADERLGLWWRALAPLWGFAIVFVVVTLLFELLHAAGITTWPGRWVWKMLVLILMVTTGSVIHLGSRALNINYDDPMKIMDAGNIINWLSLRWLSIVYLYVPIGFVVIGLWGAHNVPSTFQKLGTAILAGYSADSLFRAAVSKLQTQSNATNSEPATGGAPAASSPPAGATG